MKLKICFCGVLLLLVACGDGAQNTVELSAQNVNVTDFAGQELGLPRAARRVVALSPHIVENVFSAGAGETLVGVFAFSNYPEQAKSIEVVGGYEKTNFEKIIELQPDLIIAWQTGNSQSSISRLMELGFPVYIDQPQALKDVAKSIRDIGVLTGREESAERAADDYLSQLNAITKQHQNKPSVTAFYQVWNKPLQTINGKHSISKAIELCGGENIYAAEFALAPIINIESILERNPEVIIASGDSNKRPPEVIIASGDSNKRPPWLNEWQQWDSITAVQSDNLFYVNPDHIQRHTVRLLNGIETICQHLEDARERRASD